MNQLDAAGDFPHDIKFGRQYFSGSDFNNYSKKKIPKFEGFQETLIIISVVSWGEGFGELVLIPRGGRERRKHQHLPLKWSQLSGKAQLDLA